MIKKVISGGQTGADHAGLYAAKKCGIPTGGWAVCSLIDNTSGTNADPGVDVSPIGGYEWVILYHQLGG